MHINERDFIADRYTLSPNKVIIIADTCGKSVILHLARQLWAKIRLKAMNMVTYGRHNYVVRLRYNNDKVDLVEVMEWTAESGHEAVFSLCRELEATNLKSAMAWAIKVGRDNMRLFLDWLSPVSSYPWPGHKQAYDMGHKRLSRIYSSPVS